MEFDRTYDEPASGDDLSTLFVGRRIVEAEAVPEPKYGKPGGTLTLDDGTRLTIVGNEGGCACSNGDYTVTQLNTFDNIITAVEVKEDEDEYGGTGNVSLFVYSEGIDGVEVITTEGTDNGYYGTGFWIRVEQP